MTLSTTAALALALVAGCGDGRPQRVPIAGQVLIDGAPVTHGYVRFISDRGRPSMGKLESDGRFTLACFEEQDGAIVGEHQIEVIGEESLGPNKVRWHAPKKYADYHTSGLIQEVRDTADDLRIELTWGGGKPFVETIGSGSEGGEAFHRGESRTAD